MNATILFALGVCVGALGSGGSVAVAVGCGRSWSVGVCGWSLLFKGYLLGTTCGT